MVFMFTAIKKNSMRVHVGSTEGKQEFKEHGTICCQGQLSVSCECLQVFISHLLLVYLFTI